MRRLRPLCLAGLVLLTLAGSARAASPAGWVGTVRAPGGPYLTDGAGRRLQLHGADLVAKCGGGATAVQAPGQPCIGPARGPHPGLRAVAHRSRSGTALHRCRRAHPGPARRSPTPAPRSPGTPRGRRPGPRAPTASRLWHHRSGRRRSPLRPPRPRCTTCSPTTSAATFRVNWPASGTPWPPIFQGGPQRAGLRGLQRAGGFPVRGLQRRAECDYGGPVHEPGPARSRPAQYSPALTREPKYSFLIG
jgi:hypothetical protein